MFKVSGKYNCYLAFFTLYKFVLSNAVFLISLIPRDDNKFVILDISSSSLVITIFGPFYISDGSSESLYWLPIKTAWSKLLSQKSPPKITNFRTCPSLLCFLFTSGGGTQTRVFLLMCRTRLPPLRQQNKNKEKEAENGPFKKTTASPPTTTTASPTTTTTAGIAATLWHYPQWKDPKKFKFKILFCPENKIFFVDVVVPILPVSFLKPLSSSDENDFIVLAQSASHLNHPLGKLITNAATSLSLEKQTTKYGRSS